MPEEPQRPFTSFHVRIPTDVFTRLRSIAEREGRSINNLVVHRLRRGIDQLDQPEERSRRKPD